MFPSHSVGVVAVSHVVSLAAAAAAAAAVAVAVTAPKQLYSLLGLLPLRHCPQMNCPATAPPRTEPCHRLRSI